MTTTLMKRLRALNSKERYWLIQNALAGQDEDLRHRKMAELESRMSLSKGFRDRIGAILGVSVPENAFWAMDYHLDWLWAAKNCTDKNIASYESGYRQNQQDVDLIIAYDDPDARITRMILVEAKGVGAWSESQLKSKIERFRDLFGDDGRKWQGVEPYFLIMSPKPKKDKKGWPPWTLRNGEPCWAELYIPKEACKAMRSDSNGKSTRDGSHVKICPR